MTWVSIISSLCFALLIYTYGYSQKNETTMHFSTPPNSIYFGDYSFNKVIVVDNRFDTSSDLYFTQGKKGIIRVRWDTTLKTAVQKYIQILLDRSIPTREGNLLIELRRYETRGNRMNLSANAYYSQSDSGFIKFASIDTVFQRRWEHYLTGAAIDVFLQQIMQKRPTRITSDSPQSLSAIESNNVMSEWGRLPINTAASYPPGVYEGHMTFRQNRPTHYALDVKQSQDSVYIVGFTDTVPEKRKRINSWLNARGRGVISCNGQLYYLLDFPICLPLVKKNNTFYFHIPSSLPNMYYLGMARAEGLSTTSISDFYPIKDAGAGAASAGAFVIGTFARESKVNAIIKEGLKDPTMRDCYIDLGTGIVTYH